VQVGRDREIDYYYINMDTSVKTKLKPEYQAEFDKYKEAGNIPVFLNDKFVTGDNEKYMRMYVCMSHIYIEPHLKLKILVARKVISKNSSFGNSKQYC